MFDILSLCDSIHIVREVIHLCCAYVNDVAKNVIRDICVLLSNATILGIGPGVVHRMQIRTRILNPLIFYLEQDHSDATLRIF